MNFTWVWLAQDPLEFQTYVFDQSKSDWTGIIGLTGDTAARPFAGKLCLFICVLYPKELLFWAPGKADIAYTKLCSEGCIEFILNVGLERALM